MKYVLIAFAGLLLAVSAAGQVLNTGKLKVYIDCRVGCDFNFLKTEINLVDFVRERSAADVHLLLTGRRVGGGGFKYQINFYGQNKYEAYRDTLIFDTPPNATDAAVRILLGQYIMLGISPLVAKTPYAESVLVSMKDNLSSDSSVQLPFITTDKWNYWVFRVSASGQLNADQVYHSHVLSSDLSANRTTNKLKLEFYASGDLRKSVYTYDSDTATTTYDVKNSNYQLYHNLVRSFSSHWSYGYQTSYSNNTFNNIQRKFFFSPAIEFNVYNYKDVNNRFFVIRYGLDVNTTQYYDTTIYNKIKETLYGHRFSAAITLNRKWGSFNGGIYYRNYFKDFA